MDEDHLSEENAALRRSRLHHRAGLILYEHEKYIHAAATLFDSLEYGMRAYWIKKYSPQKEIYNPLKLFKLLDEKEVFTDNYDFSQINSNLDKFLEGGEELNQEKLCKDLMENVLSILQDLNIIPYEENLPPIDEKTWNVMGI